MAGLLGVVLLVTSRASRSGTAAPDGTAGGGNWTLVSETVVALSRDPGVWAAGFVLVAIGLGLGAVAVVGGGGGLPTGALTVAVGATIGLVVVSYLLWGTYAASRQRGLGNAQAVGVGIGTLGLLFVLLVAVQLVFGVVG
ncbi:MAG: hypothetical protein V5A46_11130 [Haloferacaceae archaeon]